MSVKRSLLPEAVEDYLLRLNRAESSILASLRGETEALPEARMQIGADQGVFLAWLVRILEAERVLEIGTFTGYSALVMAASLPDSGRLITCDVSEEWTAIAKRYWRESGLSDRIELRLGPAKDTLSRLLRESGPGSFDFAFIDADKPSYDEYYELCLSLVRPGGLIALDNMLWSGAVADPSNLDSNPVAIRALNQKIRDDPRVESCLLGVGDGMMLARVGPARLP